MVLPSAHVQQVQQQWESLILSELLYYVLSELLYCESKVFFTFYKQYFCFDKKYCVY